MLELIVFILGSFGLLILSYQSLLKPFSHGFPRLIAFEAILGLVVLNAPAWFIRPFSLAQVVSWVFLIESGFLAVHAFWTLRHFGNPDRSIHDPSRILFEKTTRLVTGGPYRFIRHPMYASLLSLAWGIFLKHINPLSALLVILTSLAVYTTAIFEEKENLRNFGEEYSQYMQKTKRFIPFVF